mgnify:CR=1 FL=1
MGGSVMYEIDEQQIRQWWQVFKADGRLVEIRLLGQSNYSGYFTDIETLLKQIKPLLDPQNGKYYGNVQAYFTLNDINPDLYSREQRNVFIKKPKATTTDKDIVRRKMILLDLDPVRTAGISSTNDELEKAHLKAVDIYRYLRDSGFSEPIITQSGNGWHLYLPCDMPNDDSHNELVERFLKSLSKIFSDEFVGVDEKVFNPARIDKLIGTWAKKGADSTERPWRMAHIVKVPQQFDVNEDGLFQSIADLLPKEEPRVLPNQRKSFNNNQAFDLVTWLNQHGIKYREKKNGSSDVFELEECPWIESHSDRKKWDSALFRDMDGKITFNCQHDHCKGKTWPDMRLLYEPNAYDRKTEQPPTQQTSRQQYTPKPKYEIKNEIPELGEKWLSMSAIHKIDLTQLEKVKTGCTELDDKIGGLYMSEVTILSGSNSSGKSSWLNTLLLNIIQQGYKVALWSGELRADILKTWIQMVAAGAKNIQQSKYDSGRYYVPDMIGRRIDEWMDGKFFLYNNSYGNKVEQMLNDMAILVKAGVKVFLLDNLMSLDIDLFEGDKNNKQKGAILRIKEFAMTNMVHVIVVAHPRKVMTFLRKNDISGTSDITNAVDNVLIMHRTNVDFLKAITEFYNPKMAEEMGKFGNIISVEKNRLYGVVDCMCGLHYEQASRRFKNTMDEQIKYGWEAPPFQQSMTFEENVQTIPSPTVTSISGFSKENMPFDAPKDEEVPF